MRISTKGLYGLAAMVELALHHGGEPVSAREIGRRQGISPRYLEQLLARLRRQGLVLGLRGASGGYVLTRAPEAITAGEVLRALEGPLGPASCVEGAGCAKADECVIRGLLARVKEGVSDVLDSVTLADLSAEARGMRRGAAARMCGA